MIGRFLSLAAVVIALPRIAGAQRVALDSSALALVRTLVMDSLQGSGKRAGQHVLPGDTLTRRILVKAGVAFDAALVNVALKCPESTGSSGTPIVAPVGYFVTLSLSPSLSGSGWRLSMSTSCEFERRGRTTPVWESAAWDVERRDGRWRITRRLYHLMT